jgi:hypothetical protein
MTIALWILLAVFALFVGVLMGSLLGPVRDRGTDIGARVGCFGAMIVGFAAIVCTVVFICTRG